MNQSWHDKQYDKRQTRQENNKGRKSRTPAQQLKLLDDRLGEGVGAKKERMRLNKLIKKTRD